MATLVYNRNDLVQFVKKHETLVGIDSDGCVFDTMEVKQVQYFHPELIKVWNLHPIDKQVRRAAEFTSLYSAWRGANRFIGLLKLFEILHQWPEVVESGVPLPNLVPLKAYVESGLPLGNLSLAGEITRTGDPELQRLLDWSLAINKDIAEKMPPIYPFKHALIGLEKMNGQSDLLVVSQTPEETLVHEWDLHGIHKYVSLIAGQELGTKIEHLELVKGDRYDRTHMLMVGDAMGDLNAAKAVGCCYYPINPGREEASWQRFHEEAYDRFLNGTFDATYQQALNEEFLAILPEKPNWLP